MHVLSVKGFAYYANDVDMIALRVSIQYVRLVHVLRHMPIFHCIYMHYLRTKS